MKTIFKYSFPHTTESFGISLPKGAEIVHVEQQRGEYCMWAIVDTNNELEVRRFEIVGTGQAIPASSVYVRTWQIGSLFVWHLFELV